MLFSTLAFAVFMTVVFLAYWLLPGKYRPLGLLLANTYFYLCFDVKCLVVLICLTVFSYFCGLYFEKTKESFRKPLFVFGVLATLASLLIFKYLNFALYTISKVASKFGAPMQETTLKLLMPVGISFFTFQMIGYLVDVYKGKTEAEHSFIKYAVFVSFFPNISSGPIERANHFIPQIDKEKEFDYDSVVYGTRLLLLGMVKKIVIADSLSKYVDAVFNSVPEHTGICFAYATLLYTFQIYCDFSGYSDMAIGVARMLGFELKMNFNRPYFASSIKEFWSRWHISLSTWFRDYVYIPLGGNRCSRLRRDVNLLLTFLASGLWHGASWTFVLWGGIHGVCQVLENRIKEFIGKRKGITVKELDKNISFVGKILLTILSFCIVSYAWMFFRANSISEAFYIVRNMFADFDFANAIVQMKMTNTSVIKTTVAIVGIMVYDYLDARYDLLSKLSRLPAVIRYVIYFTVTVLVLALKNHNGVTQEFIYFKF